MTEQTGGTVQSEELVHLTLTVDECISLTHLISGVEDTTAEEYDEEWAPLFGKIFDAQRAVTHPRNVPQEGCPDPTECVRRGPCPYCAAARTGGQADLLTDAERKALALTGELSSLVHREVILGPQQANDWNEFAQRIHALQHMIMAQAAARAYPAEFRLLGTPIRHAARPSNSGHGHVVPRPDGVKARCGGPALCAECAREAAQLGR